MATPPLTPDDVDEPSSIGSSEAPHDHNDALDFLCTLFPKDALTALPYAKRVSIAGESLGATFDGVVLELPEKPRTLYVDGKSAAHVNLRER